jgi:hypothetical protein
MKQSPLFDSLSLDPFSLHQDYLAAAEVNVGRSEIVEALMIAPMIVMLDKGLDLSFRSVASFTRI